MLFHLNFALGFGAFSLTGFHCLYFHLINAIVFLNAQYLKNDL